MNYISTRGQVKPIAFQDAVLMGLADDGGLMIPESIPNVTDTLDAWRELPYAGLAFEVIRRFVTDIPEDDLRSLIDKTYGPDYFVNDTAAEADRDVALVVQTGDVFILELWHGPTLAFKDVALQLLGNLFEYILTRRGGKLNILGATSGDTGSAAIYGCRGRAGIDIFVMHPHGRVSPIQEHQMTSVADENVHNIAIEGSFDDCQNLMKSIAGDLDFKRKYSLGAVNSVNWARVLAQIVYYFHGAFDVRKRTGAKAIRVSVPTGNFGDVLAGWYAMKMGAPIEKLILATNENDILARFYNTGDYSLGREVIKTLSPSMDIQVASNFERYLYYRVGGDADKLREMMARFAKTGSLSVEPDRDGVVDADFIAARADTEQVLKVIGKFYQQYEYVLDPHTACGVCAAEKLREERGGLGNPPRHADDLPILCLATAHPAKFPAAIAQATGRGDLAKHPAIEAMMHKPTRCKILPNDKQAVRKYIIETLG
ncbi:MAG: threonine synthase [Phycisphaerae bacterium]|nr:threonine synthase [Phycisphaerae bacterium]